MVLNRCDIAAEITKDAEQSVDHLEELLAKTTLEGPLGATKTEFDILYGEAAAMARRDAAGTEDVPNIQVRQGRLGEGVAEEMDASGWPVHAVFKSKKDRVRDPASDDCNPQ